MTQRESDRVARTVVSSSAPLSASGSGSPYLVVRTALRVWEVRLDRGILTIGRAGGSDIFLGEPGVSRHHAVVEARGDSHVIRDLASTNGTWLGLQRIEEHVLLDGDTIFIGGARLIYKRGLAGVPSPAAEPAPAAEVSQVAVVIDEASLRTQVEGIVSSDTYKQILAKARRMRKARQAD